MKNWCMMIVMLTATALGADAQDSRSDQRAGKRPLLPLAREIALARSAAPRSVSDSASVYVFTDSGYTLAVRGTNGAACYVSRSWPKSIEPHCFDAEGATTIMRIHMREVELLHRGLTPAQAEREIGPAILAGTFRLPSRPSLSYMMSADQQLIGDDGRAVGKWRPHMMIYYPYLPAMPSTDMSAGMITGAGTAQSSITIVVPEFARVAPSP